MGAEQYINQTTFRACSIYLSLGANLVLGHMWRPGGIMEHLTRRASEFEGAFFKASPEQRTKPIINYLAWNDQAPKFTEEQYGLVDQYVELNKVDPPGITTNGVDPKSEFGKFARIRALTAMRESLVKVSHIRICLGGSSIADDRRLPGVIEEALLTYSEAKPLYISSSLGGASKALSDAILHRRLSDSAKTMFYTPAPATSLFAKFNSDYPVPLTDGPSIADSDFDAFKTASAMLVQTLAERASLTQDEYLTLMTTAHVERALQLVTLGIGRLANKKGKK